jgi:hypothetical protein
VDLRGWTLEDDGDDGFLVTELLVIAAGGQVIVARESDPNENGNIPVDYSWRTGYLLTNGVDQVVLRSPLRLRDPGRCQRPLSEMRSGAAGPDQPAEHVDPPRGVMCTLPRSGLPCRVPTSPGLAP